MLPAARAFHVRAQARRRFGLEEDLFALRGDVVFARPDQAHALAARLGPGGPSGAALFGMGVLHELLHALFALHRREREPSLWARVEAELSEALGPALDQLLLDFVAEFPPEAVHRGEQSARDYLAGDSDGLPHRHWVLEELTLVWWANQNPAFRPAAELITDSGLARDLHYPRLTAALSTALAGRPGPGAGAPSLLELLLEPVRRAPDSIAGQLEWLGRRFGAALSVRRALAQDLFAEEARYFEARGAARPGPGGSPPRFGPAGEHEPERFTPDVHWMPRAVMIAKSCHVWLDQLARRYRREVRTLADIPDLELDQLAERGFTALWLIGLWQRSPASQTIKRLQGKPEALASAYSLFDYRIDPALGGEAALGELSARARARGVRLASDMVPNHMGLDSRWVLEHPERFLSVAHPPYPGYRFSGPELSTDPRISLKIEDGYWDKRDAAVVFLREDRATGERRYLYHGNDGTSTPWNDTAQLDYLSPEVREAVIGTILHVARLFPVIRFDAAMTLTKRHYQRLWFPPPGSGEGVPSRAAFALSKEDFDRRMPEEFWRQVVERVQREAPDTLLLAEAFWLMEGYFVRSLGMHRVYNSAFMNMMRNEDNAAHRMALKSVLEFNPQILQRYVNFMNNPDEETALAQFGKDGKYFGATLCLATLPGLPMFGHGQIEGFSEKYGMEYARAVHEEHPDAWLVRRHEREIFPVLRRRWLFAGAECFALFDLVTDGGGVDEDVYAFTNRAEPASSEQRPAATLGPAGAREASEARSERALVLFHNKYKHTRGRLLRSAAARGAAGLERITLVKALGLEPGPGRCVLAREHVSGLEHLFPSADLAERGWPVELGAFEYRLFWEMREVDDSPERPYLRLAEELGGAGVASVEDALAELVARPVLAALAQAQSAALAQEPGERLEQELLTLGATARVLDPALPTPEPGLAAEVGALWQLLAAEPALAPFTDQPLAGLHPRALLALVLLLRRAAPLLRSPALLARTTTRTLSARLGPGGVQTAALALLLAAEVAELLPSPASTAAERRAQLHALLSSETVERFLGVHLYEEVRWYRKEEWQALMRGRALLAAVLSPPARGHLDELEQALAWGEASRYRFDSLLLLLGAAPPAQS